MSTLQSRITSPASGGKAKQLVIFLHGYGSNGDDLMGLAPYFSKMLPNAEFLSPNALEAGEFGSGYQWFSLGDRRPEKYISGIASAGPKLQKYISEQLELRGLDESNLALVGFSQGAMIAIHIAARREKPVAGVVAFSGALIGPELLEKEVKSRPPILIVHGERDDVVPFASMAAAEAALTAQNFSVATLARPSLAHSIDDQGLLAAASFLKDKLKA